MSKKSSKKSKECQSFPEEREAFQLAMAEVGFVVGTQTAYLRALDRFAKRLDRKTPASATPKDGRRYLTELKQAGVSKTLYSCSAAALRFFFEEVRGIEWKPISALQKRFVEDMSPDMLNDEQVREYFVHLTCERKLARPTVTIALCGIKFFYEKTLKRDWSLTGVPVPKRENRLPVVLSRNEVHTILSEIRILRHSASLGLSPVFRARFRDMLRENYPEYFARIKPSVWKWKKKWVVHSKPVGSGLLTYKYLARYVHQVFLFESAILRHNDKLITVRYRESGSNKKRTMRLEPMEFLRRFLQHVLPSRFCKVRHYGLHHSSKRETIKLLQATMAIAMGKDLPEDEPCEQPAPITCEKCKCVMEFEARYTQQQRLQLEKSSPRGPP